jgi:hypothetical protein
MNLVVCPSRTFAVYLVTYVRTFGNGRNFHFIISGLSEPPKELATLADEYHITFIPEEDIQKTRYEELIIHSYFKFNNQQRYIAQIDFRTLTLYSDGIRNGFYGLPNLDVRLTKLISFGLTLRETSFDICIPIEFGELRHDVVDLNQISVTWSLLQQMRGMAIPILFNSSDLLIVMRYWDLPGSIYEFKPGVSILDYLKEEFSNRYMIDRVIFRRDSRFDREIRLDELKSLFPYVSEFVFWEEIFDTQSDFPELTAPESVIFSNGAGPGYFFGFDSSLNVLVGWNWVKTKILWPQPHVFRGFFKIPRSFQHVKEQSTWMKAFIDSHSDEEVIELQVSGHQNEQYLTQISFRLNEQERDALTQERDALTQERDALTQERDALTQERDALTQERDALTQERNTITNSTIWRSTFLLRRVITNLRKLR